MDGEGEEGVSSVCGASSEKLSLRGLELRAPLHRDLNMGVVSIQKITEIVGMAMTYTMCGMGREEDPEEH